MSMTSPIGTRLGAGTAKRVIVALMAVAIVWGVAFFRLSPAELKESLAWWTPRSIELSLLVAFVGMVASFRILSSLIPVRMVLAAISVWLVSLALVSFLPPETHRIFYDEDIYQNVAQNILWRGKAQMCNEGVLAYGGFECWATEYNKEPNAYPVLLSAAARFSGVSEKSAHRVNRWLFATSSALIVLLAYLLWESGFAAVIASLVFLLMPVNLLWGATTAVEPGTAAFAVFAVFAGLVFARRPSLETCIFVAGAASFAAQWRPESGLILAVVGAGIVFFRYSLLRRSETYVLGVLAFLLLVPHFFHLLAVLSEPWGSADGAKFAWRHVSPNASANFAYWIERREVPWLFSVLAVLGLWGPSKPFHRRSSLIVVGLWFVLCFGIFLPFHAGSYRYGADIRFAVLSHAPFALFAGAGAERIGEWMRTVTKRSWHRWAVAMLVIYAATYYLPLVRSVGAEASSARADHEIAESWRDEIPENSMVLSHNPGMWQVMGQSAGQASMAQYQEAHLESLFRRFSGGIYFHYNFWCLIDDPVQNAFCSHILEHHGTRVVAEKSFGFERHVLYRLLPTVSPPPPPVPPVPVPEPQ